MKKTILVALFVVIASTSIAQEPTKKPFEVISTGFITNYITLNDINLQRFSYGASINICNFHIDASVAPALHRRSTQVDYWENESRILLINAGVRIKVAKGLGITPVLGYLRADIGDVDGGDWTLDDEGVVNKFIVRDSRKYFNYGGIIDYTFYDPTQTYGFKLGILAQRYNFGVIASASFRW